MLQTSGRKKGSQPTPSKRPRFPRRVANFQVHSPGLWVHAHRPRGVEAGSEHHNLRQLQGREAHHRIAAAALS